MDRVEILIIGGGAAGMAAAVAAGRKGYRKILLADRAREPGGILLQCAHKGFGLGYYQEELTGPEYAKRFARELDRTPVTSLFSTSVLEVTPERKALLSGKNGVCEIRFDKVIFATGCRERTLYSQNIAGTRPAGIMTCGMAQKLMNLDGLEIGDDVVILGSGDIGQIVARQIVESGKKVIAMIEIKPEPGGLLRNRIRCIKECSIPLILNSTITRIHGEKRITGVTVKNVRTGQESFLPCKNLLTAIGLIPELEAAALIQKDGKLPDWAFKVGNCDTVHDIVDGVTADALKLEDVL